MRNTCLDMVYRLATYDKRIFFIGSDLAVGSLQKFKEEMPYRFFMEGISESNIIGMAAGLALEGKIVYVNTLAAFITRRCFEQIVIDLCLHNLNVRLIGNGGGLVYSHEGPTHQVIEDISILRSIPNMTILVPSDAEEMKRLMPETVDHKGPIYIRLARGGDTIVSKDEPFKIGKAIQIRDGKDALVITTGITLKLAIAAAEELTNKNISVGILHVPTIKPLDKERILGMASKVSTIITIEEHSIIGGLGGAVAELIAETNFNTVKHFKRIGVEDIFPENYGDQAESMSTYGITKEHIITSILESI